MVIFPGGPGGATGGDEVLVTVPDDAEPGALVEVLLEDTATMRRGARRFSATRLDPSEGWGYSGSESRGDVERVAREEAARQAAEQARQEPEHPEIVDEFDDAFVDSSTISSTNSSTK